ncbi:MAG: anaerobic sulfatase maturase [Spirochaetaceae bacterium]
MGKSNSKRKTKGVRPAATQEPFSLLIKPASGECNLRCDYCFYLEKCDLFPSEEPRRMSEETVVRMLESYFGTRQPVYSFAWQGGEPTLMGLGFFRRVVELQRELAPPGAHIANAIQTNATGITEEFAQFLGRNNFLVGVSVDGPAEIHDTYRRGSGGGPTHQLVLKGIERLKEAGVQINALTVVNSLNVDKASLIYDYIKNELGFRYHQYIPLVEWDEKGELLPFAITGKQWGRFLNELFDRWYPRDLRRVSIRLFDSILQLLAHGSYAQCTMAGRCASYVVVEHNGEIYPCDFYVEPELRLGSVHGGELADARRTPTAKSFAAQKSRWPETCKTCPYLTVCSGDCPRMRRNGGPSALCEGWKAFYGKNLDRLKGIAGELPDNNGGVERLAATLRPEDPCFCGSGKRYGNCHGVTESGPPASRIPNYQRHG